jgi:hypothetical protein
MERKMPWHGCRFVDGRGGRLLGTGADVRSAADSNTPDRSRYLGNFAGQQSVMM